jgi:hypothetical protein
LFSDLNIIYFFLQIGRVSNWLRDFSITLYYDQQGTDEYLDVSPEFWSGFQLRPRAAQQTPADCAPNRRRGKAVDHSSLTIVGVDFGVGFHEAIEQYCLTLRVHNFCFSSHL